MEPVTVRAKSEKIAKVRIRMIMTVSWQVIWHAEDHRSPFIFNNLETAKCPCGSKNRQMCRTEATFFHATVFQ